MEKEEIIVGFFGLPSSGLEFEGFFFRESVFKLGDSSLLWRSENTIILI